MALVPGRDRHGETELVCWKGLKEETGNGERLVKGCKVADAWLSSNVNKIVLC